MKKTLLSVVAALGLAATAMAQMPKLYQKISGDAATRVYASQMSAADMEAAVKAFDADRCWGGANFFYTTGETLYADDEVKLTVLGQGDSGEMRVYDATWEADVAAAQTYNPNINYLAVVGSSINRNVLDGTEIIDYSAPKTNFSAAGQGAIVVNVTKAGMLSATATRGNNNTNIGIWQVANEADKIEAQKILDAAEANDALTDEEYQAEIARGNALKNGKWVNYTNFESKKDGTSNGTVKGNVDTDHTYLIVSLSKNNCYVHYVTFTPELKETWSVGQAIATVEPEFNGNQAADAEAKLMTVADGSAYIYGQTENVKITYRSTPNGKAADSPSGNDSDLDQCLAGKKTWVDLRANGSGNQIWDETFTHCIMGRGNPSISRTYWYEQTNDGIADRVTEEFYEPTCGKLPVVGTYIEVEVATAGTMEAILMVWRPKNALYIIDESTTKPLAPEAVSFTGWYNNNTLEPIAERTLDENYLPSRDGDPGKQFAGNFKFSLNAGKYMILSPKSQIGLYGYKFTPGPSTAIENVETVAPAVKSNAIYNLAGQVVDENYKGIVIKNGKKYLMK